MKKWFTLLAAAVLCIPQTVPAKDVKGTVIAQKDGQPIVGAEITVKGTDITAVTDMDGRFVLTGIPDDAKKLTVHTIGMEWRTARIPDEGEILVKLRKEERVVTPFVTAGMCSPMPTSTDDNSIKGSGKIGFQGGVGVSFALSRLISLTPSVNISQQYTTWRTYESGKTVNTDVTPTYLTVPLLVDFKIWNANSFRTLLRVGPYVGFGISGKYKVDGQEGDLFKKPAGADKAFYKKVDAGLALGLAYVLRHVYIGGGIQWSAIPFYSTDSPHEIDLNNCSFDISVGYYF